MNPNKITNKLLTTFFLLTSFSTYAQQKSYDTTTIKLFDDIETIQSVYESSDHISFRATYYMEDVDSVTVRDTSVANYQVNGENFHLTIDSMESIQNGRYFITIYYDNNSLVIQKPTPLPKQVLGVNVKDSLFQKMVMTGMTFSDSSGFRKIYIQCNVNSPFVNYEILFDKTNYRVNTIKYSLRKELDSTSTKRVNMVMKFDNYATAGFDDSAFSTDSYFTVNSNGEIKRSIALRSDLEVINMLGN